MNQPFAFGPRTRLAAWAIRQAKGFAALVAPWLGQPGDVPMRRSTVFIGAVMLLLALLTAVLGTSVALHAVLIPVQREETTP